MKPPMKEIVRLRMQPDLPRRAMGETIPGDHRIRPDLASWRKEVTTRYRRIHGDLGERQFYVSLENSQGLSIPGEVSSTEIAGSTAPLLLSLPSQEALGLVVDFETSEIYSKLLVCPSRQSEERRTNFFGLKMTPAKMTFEDHVLPQPIALMADEETECRRCGRFSGALGTWQGKAFCRPELAYRCSSLQGRQSKPLNRAAQKTSMNGIRFQKGIFKFSEAVILSVTDASHAAELHVSHIGKEGGGGGVATSPIHEGWYSWQTGCQVSLNLCEFTFSTGLPIRSRGFADQHCRRKSLAAWMVARARTTSDTCSTRLRT